MNKRIYVAAAATLAVLSSQSSFFQFASASLGVYAPLPITSFCAVGRYACAAFSNNKIKCWGKSKAWGVYIPKDYDGTDENNYALGNNLPYISVSNGSSLIQKISCGYEHVCVKFESGSLKCLGSNSNGQIGIASQINIIGNFSDYFGDGVIAANLGSGLGALDVSAAYSFTCALTTENKVKCFGFNYYAQLGLGDNIDRGRSPYDMGENLTYIDLGTNVEVKSIHSGPESMHNCVILSAPTNSAQRIKCWGYNSNGQLGYGDKFSRGDSLSEMGDNLPLVDLGTESRVKQLQFGYISTCVLLVNDKLKCFGSNEYGELGYGSTGDIVLTGDALPFVQIDVGKSIKSISSGSQHNCVLYSDDVTVKCIGYNSFGQLGQGDNLPTGDGPETTYPNITAIDFGIGTTKISAVYCGSNSNCIVLENYLVKCWGNGYNDALLVGSNENLGDQPYEMGTNLSYAQLFAPTQSPTQSPTLKPTLAPTLPTQSPTIRPTSKPTENTKSEGFANQRSFFALHFYVVVAFLLLLVA